MLTIFRWSVAWSNFIFFLMAAVFFTVIWAFIDDFRRPDHSGWAKAGWAFLIIILPLLGTNCIIARPAEV